LLDDPGDRAILSSRLALDLLQHLFGEVKALLSVVSIRHELLLMTSDESFFPGDVIHRREGLDPITRDLPRLLDDPRERTILSVRLLLNLLQHLLWKIQRLLSFVGTCHRISPGIRADYSGKQLRERTQFI